MTDAPTLMCSQSSHQTDESLYGTATTATIWLLLEFDGRWERKAFEGADLPAPVKTHLADLLETLPEARIQLIRQNPRLAPEGIAFFVAVARDVDPLFYEFTLAQYEDLLALDVPAMCAGDPAYDDHRREEPLFLVCTHGKRDQCCALHGLSTYAAAVEVAGAEIWQTSHVGGHRFAANVLCFPHGLVNGRVTPGTVSDVIEMYRRGLLLLQTLRGRACYNQPVQAAEYYLRAATATDAVDAFRLVSTEPTAPDRWQIQFEDRRDGVRHVLDVAAEEADFQVYTSCIDTTPSPVIHHRLLHYDVTAPTP